MDKNSLFISSIQDVQTKCSYVEYEAFDFWTTVFNFGYYTGVIPFRFVRNPKSGIFNIHQNWVQWIIWIFLSALGLIASIACFWQSLQSTENPLMLYFDVTDKFADNVYHVVLICVAHFRKASFLNLFHELYRQKLSLCLVENNNSDRRWQRKNKLIVISLCICAYTLNLRVVASNVDSMTNEFLKKISYNGTPISPITKLIVQILVWISLLSNNWMVVFVDLWVAVSALFLGYLVYEFYGYLQCAQTPVGRVLVKYKNLQKVNELLNEALAPLFLTFMLGAMPYYVRDISSIHTMTISESIDTAIFVLYYLVILIYAANLNTKMYKMKSFFQDERNRRLIPPTTLMIIINDFAPYSNIGLGWNGVFVFNFNILASLVVTIITFIVVAVQLKQT